MRPNTEDEVDAVGSCFIIVNGNFGVRYGTIPVLDSGAETTTDSEPCIGLASNEGAGEAVVALAVLFCEGVPSPVLDCEGDGLAGVCTGGCDDTAGLGVLGSDAGDDAVVPAVLLVCEVAGTERCGTGETRREGRGIGDTSGAESSSYVSARLVDASGTGDLFGASTLP